MNLRLGSGPMLDDTIAAISTPLGEGGLAVIRISGPKALAVADACFEPAGRGAIGPSSAPSHSVHYGRIRRQGQVVDEVLLTVLRAPRTYTREDTVEISCHGGMLPSRLVLEAVLAGGARLAHPGEFTRRAFLNGRLDLAQAEAVADIIHSRTTLALTAAQEQLAGRLSQRIHQLRDDLMQVLAHVEAHIDFPEEQIAPDTREQLVARLERGVAFADALLQTAHEGQLLRRGVRAAIVGRPNVGKSSLLNQLLGRDRAIVSPRAGTTRDTIEETADIRGLPVVLVDTAGLRDSADALEQEGVRRSRQTLAEAELILHVLDGSVPFTTEDDRYLAECGDRRSIVVINKSDLPPQLLLPSDLYSRSIRVSCATGEGIEALRDAVKALLWSGEIGAEMLQTMISVRHQDALRRSREALHAAGVALREDVSLELVAVDLRVAVNAVGEVVGLTSTEELLDTIFAQFCIGK